MSLLRPQRRRHASRVGSGLVHAVLFLGAIAVSSPATADDTLQRRADGLKMLGIMLNEAAKGSQGSVSSANQQIERDILAPRRAQEQQLWEQRHATPGGYGPFTPRHGATGAARPPGQAGGYRSLDPYSGAAAGAMQRQQQGIRGQGVFAPSTDSGNSGGFRAPAQPGAGAGQAYQGAQGTPKSYEEAAIGAMGGTPAPQAGAGNGARFNGDGSLDIDSLRSDAEMLDTPGTPATSSSSSGGGLATMQKYCACKNDDAPFALTLCVDLDAEDVDYDVYNDAVDRGDNAGAQQEMSNNTYFQGRFPWTPECAQEAY